MYNTIKAVISNYLKAVIQNSRQKPVINKLYQQRKQQHMANHNTSCPDKQQSCYLLPED